MSTPSHTSQKRNFSLTLISLAATKTGDELASARLVLAWLFVSLGTPEFMIALLVPLREAGALLPQIIIAPFIQQASIRKGFWVVGSLIQAAALAGIALAAVSLEGQLAGWTILALLALFALARGLCSVAIKDVMGKTIAKGTRGRLSGWATTIAGILALGTGIVLAQVDQMDSAALGLLLIFAALLWLTAALLYAMIREPGETTAANGSLFRKVLRDLCLLRNDPEFRHYCITRALLLSTALAFPFYAVLASQYVAENSLSLLGGMIAAGGLAGMLAAPLWGRWSDQSSRTVLVISALIAGLLGITTFMLDLFSLLDVSGGLALIIIYFIIAIAHHGVRIARATYLIDIGTVENRAAYTAVSNTLIGLLLLAGSSIGLLTEFVGAPGLILILALVSLLASLSAWKMKEA